MPGSLNVVPTKGMGVSLLRLFFRRVLLLVSAGVRARTYTVLSATFSYRALNTSCEHSV